MQQVLEPRRRILSSTLVFAVRPVRATRIFSRPRMHGDQHLSSRGGSGRSSANASNTSRDSHNINSNASSSVSGSHHSSPVLPAWWRRAFACLKRAQRHCYTCLSTRAGTALCAIAACVAAVVALRVLFALLTVGAAGASAFVAFSCHIDSQSCFLSRCLFLFFRQLNIFFIVRLVGAMSCFC
jgi:hypothetical protein